MTRWLSFSICCASFISCGPKFISTCVNLASSKGVLWESIFSHLHVIRPATCFDDLLCAFDHGHVQVAAYNLHVLWRRRLQQIEELLCNDSTATGVVK